MITEKEFVIMVASGAIFSIAFIGFVWLTGSTFGQRCAAAGFTEQAFEQCVDRLVDGGSVYP